MRVDGCGYGATIECCLELRHIAGGDLRETSDLDLPRFLGTLRGNACVVNAVLEIQSILLGVLEHFYLCPALALFFRPLESLRKAV